MLDALVNKSYFYETWKQLNIRLETTSLNMVVKTKQDKAKLDLDMLLECINAGCLMPEIPKSGNQQWA